MDLTGGCCGTPGALKGCEVADSGSSERSQATGPPGLGLSLTAEMLGAAGLLLGQRVDGKVQVPSLLLPSGVLVQCSRRQGPRGSLCREAAQSAWLWAGHRRAGWAWGLESTAAQPTERDWA